MSLPQPLVGRDARRTGRNQGGARQGAVEWPSAPIRSAKSALQRKPAGEPFVSYSPAHVVDEWRRRLRSCPMVSFGTIATRHPSHASISSLDFAQKVYVAVSPVVATPCTWKRKASCLSLPGWGSARVPALRLMEPVLQWVARKGEPKAGGLCYHGAFAAWYPVWHGASNLLCGLGSFESWKLYRNAPCPSLPILTTMYRFCNSRVWKKNLLSEVRGERGWGVHQVVGGAKRSGTA